MQESFSLHVNRANDRHGHIQLMHNVFIASTIIEMLNYIQFCTKCTSLQALLGFLILQSTHLANGQTESIVMRLKCSQTRFKAMTSWCWDAECSSQGNSLVMSHLLLGVRTTSIMAHCKTNTKHSLHFLPSSVKAKILFRFLSVSKNRY